MNDATALILYRAAVGVAVGGSFVLGKTLIWFVFAAAAGVVLGIAVSKAARWAICATEDSFTQIAITLLAPYVAWVLGELTHASAVLACVAGGLHVRRHFSAAVAPVTRLQAGVVWNLLVFLLNGFIFILIGLQLGALREAVPSDRFESLMIAGVLVSATAIVVRLGWVPLAAVIPRLLSPSLRARDPLPAWSNLFVIGWTGMRGIVTLAAALALPVTTEAGALFPFRAEIILLSFSVILATLVLQGLSLTPLIRALRLEEDRGQEQEERQARQHAATAALTHLKSLAGQGWPSAHQLDQLRVHYDRQLQRFAPSNTVDQECSTQAAESFRRLRHETLSAERAALINLRNDGTISDEVLHRLEYELDVEALRLGFGGRRPS